MTGGAYQSAENEVRECCHDDGKPVQLAKDVETHTVPSTSADRARAA